MTAALRNKRADAWVPKELGRYQIVSPLGRGGMAQVFLARMQSLGGFERDVAVKVLLPEYAAEPEFVDMLLDEARIAGALSHPCVVQILDVGRQDELFYLVMEYVEGDDLRSIMRRSLAHRMSPAAALFILHELLRGLQTVHDAVGNDGRPRHIVHRDVSPANVLIDHRGVVKLGDFGIAHASRRLTTTRQGAVKGKLRYMAPEQIAVQPVDHRADLYAAGVVLCELVLGPSECDAKKLTNLGPVFSWARVRLRRPELMPLPMVRILDKALAEQPSARYADAAEFRRDVCQLLHQLAPGYGGEELAREIAAMTSPMARQGASASCEIRTERENGTAADDGNTSAERKRRQSGSISVLRTPTPSDVTVPTPKVDTTDAGTTPQGAATAEENERTLDDPSVRAPNYGELPATVPFRRARAWSTRVWSLPRRVLVAGAACALVALAMPLMLWLWLGHTAAPPPAPAPIVIAPTPSPPARPDTGTLFVEGPRGAVAHLITRNGSVSYPAAPTRIELPPGAYELRLRRPGKRAASVLNVFIRAGETTTIH